MASIQKGSAHKLTRLDSDWEKRAMYVCERCTRHWRCLRELSISHNDRQSPQQCNQQLRYQMLACKKKRTFWKTLSKRWQDKLAKGWKLTANEKRALNRVQPSKKKTEWERDLTKEGIEPNPGPLRCLSWNCQGQENTFSFLQILHQCSSLPHGVALQETNLDEVKRARVMHDLSRLGFRAWASTPAPKINTQEKFITVVGSCLLSKTP